MAGSTLRVIIFALLVVVLSQFVLSAEVSFYQFTDNTTDMWSGNNLSAPASYATTYPSFAVTNSGATKSAKFNTASAITASTDWITTSAYSPFTVTGWFNGTLVAAEQLVYQRASSVAGTWQIYSNAGKIRLYYFDDTSTTCDLWETTTAWFTANGWHFIAVVMNSTDVMIQVDATNQNFSVASPTYPAAACAGVGTAGRYIGKFTGTGTVDHVKIFSDVKLDYEVNELYGYGYISGAAPGAPSPPTWSSPTPTDGDTDNVQAVLNASCGAGLNYYIYLDGSNPPTTAVLSNSTSGVYTTNVSAGTYYYSAACFNTTNNLFSTNTTPRSWTYDIQAPAITLNGENEFNDYNRSLALQFDEWLNMSMNFSDDNDLFAWNITINASNGTGVYTDQNSSLSGTSWTMTRNVNVTTWVAGWYDVQVWVSDSHTAHKIPDYQVSSKKSSITFKPENDNNIKIETREGSTISAQKLEDRYTFRMVFDDSATKTRTFDVKTDKCPLYYRPDSGYKAHFVSFCDSRTGGNWIDFEGVSGTAFISRVSDFHYEVTIQAVPGDVTFNSIGGLNTYNRNWSWYRGTYSEDADRATAGDPFNVHINMTLDASFNLSASFNWNGTPQNVTVTNGSGWQYFEVELLNESAATYWYTWTVNVTQDDGNTSQLYLNLSHTVEDWYLDECSVATNRTIRWDLYDEDIPANSLNGTAELYMEYWPVSANNTKTLNHSYSKATFFEVCLSPSDLNFTADIYLRYTVDGAFTHRFYVQEGDYNVTRTDYSIYNFKNQTSKSDMKITTRLEDDYSYFERVLVYLQRFYVGQGVWRTVQMDRSGDYGLVFFNVIEENTDYRLLYYDEDNNLLHQTTSMKFICTAGVCDLTQLLGDYEATTTSSEVTATLTYNNATSIVTVAWSGPPLESHSVALKAVKETVTGPLTLCTSTQTGASGSFTCNVSGTNGQVYVTAEVDSESYAVAEWVDTRTQKFSQQMSRAESSLWSFGMAATIVMIGAFSPVGAVIALVIGLIALFFLGILGPLTMTALILSVVVGIAISLKVKT